jgi:hypothetical protein
MYLVISCDANSGLVTQRKNDSKIMFWREIIISIISSSITAALIIFVFKEGFKQWWAYRLKKKQIVFHKEVEYEFFARTSSYEKTTNIYTEIIELVYRIKNIALQASKSDNRFAWDNQAFSAYCYHLTDSLYKYRLFLTGDTFDHLHKFKHQAQDFRVLSDITDRPEITQGNAEFDPEVKKKLDTLAKNLDHLYHIITKQIQQQLRIIQNRKA